MVGPTKKEVRGLIFCFELEIRFSSTNVFRFSLGFIALSFFVDFIDYQFKFLVCDFSYFISG